MARTVIAPSHPAWVEVLAYAGDVDGAQRAAEGLPQRTRWERFEREFTLVWVEWVASGHADETAAVEAAASLADPEERLRAEALLAFHRAKTLRAELGDWMEPLVRLRPALAARADRVLWSDWWPAQLRVTLVAAIGLPSAVLALGLLF